MVNHGFFKKNDTAYIKQLQEDVKNLGETVFIRLVSSRTTGNAKQGTQPTLIYKTKKTKAIINRLTPEEVVSSAGIYQHGDLRIQLLEELKFANDSTGDIGERIIYQKTTYRIVGRTQNEAIENKNMLFSYNIRKVGNA